MNHRVSRAFTLIELLVVIAIIAILAAILFPVFAQAKAAAKSSASLSNTKQITLAGIQYEADYDDVIPLSQAWGGSAPVNGYQITSGGINFNSWRALVFPYTKNVDIYKDPVASTVYQNAGFAAAPFLNNVMYSQYGFNHMHLAPIDLVGGVYQTTSVSATAVANPADTVMYAQQYAVFVDSPYNWTGVAGGFRYYGLVDAPDCNGLPVSRVCIDNWGMGSAWEASLQLKDDTGGKSGGVAPRGGTGAITTFTDGHAKKMSLGALAAGTNWAKTRAASSVGVIPAERSKYIWDIE